MGQTATDKLISPIVGKAVTTEFDLDARIDTLEAGVPASEVTYTPAVLTDWDANADPGNVDAALDQLAERVDDNEIAIAAAAPTAGVRRLVVTIGAEVANVRSVTVTVVDGAGATVAGADKLFVGLYNDEFCTSRANAASYPFADVGSGSIGNDIGGGNQLVAATTAAGVLQMTEHWAGVPPHWMIYLATPDIAAAAEKVGALGGKVVVPAFDTPYGRISIVNDPQGAVFTLIQLK